MYFDGRLNENFKYEDISNISMTYLIAPYETCRTNDLSPLEQSSKSKNLMRMVLFGAIEGMKLKIAEFHLSLAFVLLCARTCSWF